MKKLEVEIEREDYRERYKRLNRTFGILLIIALVGIFLLGSVGLYYKSLYHQAINEGAKSIVTAIEMVVACQAVGNVTSEQVQEQYIKQFIFNKTK